LKLLLDTHAALWWLAADPRFSATARSHVLRAGNEVFLSAAVAWEIAVKRSLGKLEAPVDWQARLLAAGARELPITLAHAAGVEHLRWHHRDPFDRLLVAQATAEAAALVSADEALRPYGVQMVW
jgi:PIN domain nuclease of toxin-antitoxin system